VNAQRDIVTRAYESENFDELVGDLLKEIELRNYRITRINHIDNVLDQAERGLGSEVEFRHYKIIEFCNLNSCVELISSNLLSGVFMPVRFIVYQRSKDPRTFIAFLKPTAFARLFDSEALTRVAAALEGDMSDVLEELAF
jgi:uncharacterized protein (DUF302 family)